MRILIDICHPAHVHFFHNPLRILRARGHEVIIASRHKDLATDLLDQLEITHIALSTAGKGGVRSLMRELVERECKLYRLVRECRPDVMAAVGGVFISHVGRMTRTPALVFTDTENAVLQNTITFPFATCVVAPRSYQGRLPSRRSLRYDGYHELSYLHPAYFEPDRDKALSNGLSGEGDTFLIRLVAWRASHDIGEHGWNREFLTQLVETLESLGTVLISSETELPSEFSPYRYRGNPADIHHVLASCRAYIGESATMASESAVLGVPAVYAAETGRGYTDEQEQRYDLVRNVRKLAWPQLEAALDWALCQQASYWRQCNTKLLADTTDVAQFVAECIEKLPIRSAALKRQL